MKYRIQIDQPNVPSVVVHRDAPSPAEAVAILSEGATWAVGTEIMVTPTQVTSYHYTVPNLGEVRVRAREVGFKDVVLQPKGEVVLGILRKTHYDSMATERLDAIAEMLIQACA